MAKISLLFLLAFLPLFSSDEPSSHAQLGLSVKTPPLTPATLQKLARIGIRFTFPTPRQNLRSNLSNSREGGVLFITDFNEKAEAFRKWIEIPQFRPGNILMIEDEKDRLIELEKTGGLRFDPSP